MASHNFSCKDQSKIISINTCDENPNFSSEQVENQIDSFTNELPCAQNAGVIKQSLFKGVNYPEEIGVSRLLWDRIYHLPKLLEKLELIHIGHNSFQLRAEENTSAGVVGLEYFFEASNDEEASKIASIFKCKIVGVGEHLLLACWDFANHKASWIFEVNTIDLFRKCYPLRKAHPNGEERKDFFNLIRLLERTKLFLTREKKKKVSVTYELPILQIYSFERSLTLNGWPRRLKLQVIPSAVFEDKMTFLAAPISKSTLDLDIHYIHLANMIQIRRAQCNAAESISFSLGDLLIGARLVNTANIRLTEAKKLLFSKLVRIKSLGIITDYSCQLLSNLQEKIWIYF